MKLPDNSHIFDCEVFAQDWLFVFKSLDDRTYTVIVNDPDALDEFMKSEPFLIGFNNKAYDQYILKAALLGLSPEEIKEISDTLVLHGIPGWQLPVFRDCKIYFSQCDLMDDTQMGTSLKDIEGHLGMSIEESTVSFDIDRKLTEEELDDVIRYCKHDVDATEILLGLRETYISNKLTLGEEKGIVPSVALYYTNAKLTASYLDAVPQERGDEREYVFPENILWEYIPAEAREFFDRIHDKSIHDEDLFSQVLDLNVGGCVTRIAWGGIHGAIPHYREEATPSRLIRNADVGSYYPHLMTIDGYSSRNIPSVDVYSNMLERRMQAKKSGNKALANALKLVANTTYGAMLNKFNALYDPKQGRSVCITGQLRLLELANHLLHDCPTLRVIQLNTDGIMCSFDLQDQAKWDAVLKEWQERTGFTLEEDDVHMICQKDVNNYVEIPEDGDPKVKGGYLVRGVVTNGDYDFPAHGFPPWQNLMGGAFKINCSATIVSAAVINCIAYGIPVETTIRECDDILAFQIIAKSWSKCGSAYQEFVGRPNRTWQRVNRVYATDRYDHGTLWQIDPSTGNPRKLTGLPMHVVVDNDNKAIIEWVDKDWYIRLARKYVDDFYGKKRRRSAKRTRKINDKKAELLALL